MNQLDISLIIPSLNRAFLLAKTLPLYLNLPLREVILCDDGSKDNTAEIAQKYGCEKLIYHRSDKTRGQAAMRNAGMKIARCNWILMGEDDVLMDSHYVATLFHLAGNLNADIVAGRLIAMQHAERMDEAKKRSDGERNTTFFFKQSLTNDFSCIFPTPISTPHLHACALMKRELPLRQPFDEQYSGNGLREETDFYFRCFQDGAKMYFCSDAIAYHMFHNYGGGSRKNHLWYAYHCVLNNHRFLNKHWSFINNHVRPEEERLFFETRLHWKHLRMTFLFWMNAKMPRFHTFLKKKLKSSAYQNIH